MYLYWGLGIGDWGLGIAQSPIPNPLYYSILHIKTKTIHNN